jgi:hypothetical protein
MLREIYIRDENDPHYDPSMIEYTNEVENVISQIRMILGTKPGDMLGDYNFGIDLEYIVYNTKKSAEELADKIREQIKMYVYHGDKISVDVEVSFGDSGLGYDYGVIDILINGTKAIGFLVDKNL